MIKPFNNKSVPFPKYIKNKSNKTYFKILNKAKFFPNHSKKQKNYRDHYYNRKKKLETNPLGAAQDLIVKDEKAEGKKKTSEFKIPFLTHYFFSLFFEKGGI